MNNQFGRTSFITWTEAELRQERQEMMSKYEYQIEKHITTEWIVTCQVVGRNLREPVAKCNSQGNALTIKGLYEKYDKELEERAKRLDGDKEDENNT